MDIVFLIGCVLFGAVFLLPAVGYCTQTAGRPNKTSNARAGGASDPRHPALPAEPPSRAGARARRLVSRLCVLPILDPVRVAEDFARVDQLSRDRFELVIGKGNEARQLPMVGVRKEDQDKLLAEKFELLRVL